MIPASFQSRRALALLNTGAVGVALAAVVAAVFAGMTGPAALASGAPTLLVGTLWAWVLRWPKTVGNSSFRWGWVASMPLAIVNASLSAGLLMMLDKTTMRAEDFVFGAVAGATFGAIFWIPALVATLVCFGLPIAWAQRLAKKGLAGEERGEWIVGLVCVVMSLVGLLASTVIGARARDAQLAALGLDMTRALAILGVLAGGASTGLALAREARRRAFVRDAEAGKIAGYRVDPTDEGKVLVRVLAQGKGYRVADFEEEVFELDAEGEATRPKRLSGAGADSS